MRSKEDEWTHEEHKHKEYSELFERYEQCLRKVDGPASASVRGAFLLGKGACKCPKVESLKSRSADVCVTPAGSGVTRA